MFNNSDNNSSNVSNTNTGNDAAGVNAGAVSEPQDLPRPAEAASGLPTLSDDLNADADRLAASELLVPVFYDERRRRWPWVRRAFVTLLALSLLAGFVLALSIFVLPLMPHNPPAARRPRPGIRQSGTHADAVPASSVGVYSRPYARASAHASAAASAWRQIRPRQAASGPARQQTAARRGRSPTQGCGFPAIVARPRRIGAGQPGWRYAVRRTVWTGNREQGTGNKKCGCRLSTHGAHCGIAPRARRGGVLCELGRNVVGFGAAEHGASHALHTRMAASQAGRGGRAEFRSENSAISGCPRRQR